MRVRGNAFLTETSITMRKLIRTTGPHFEIELDENGNLVQVSINRTIINGQKIEKNNTNNLKQIKNGKK
jgi:hypothetical protein